MAWYGLSEELVSHGVLAVGGGFFFIAKNMYIAVRILDHPLCLVIFGRCDACLMFAGSLVLVLHGV